MRRHKIYQKSRQTISKTWKAVRKALVSGQMRRYRAWLFQAYVLIALLAFSLLALAASAFTYLEFDLELTREIQEEWPAWAGWVMLAVSWPGYMQASLIIVGVTVTLLAVLGLRWEAVAALFAALSTGILNYIIKIAIRRPRPSADLVTVIHELNSYSFPSGHVMFYTGFFGFLLFLAFTLLRPSWKRSTIMLILFAFIALVGLSRMYLGEHWASDVIGGYLLGSLALILAIQVYREGKARFIIDQPSAPPEPGEQDLPVLDPHIIPLGARSNEYNPDSSRARPPFTKSAGTDRVTEARRSNRGKRPARRDRKGSGRH